jgi:hypothetical protein
MMNLKAPCETFYRSSWAPWECRWGMSLLICLCAVSVADARDAAICPPGVDATGSMALGTKSADSGCSPSRSHGYPIPDPTCTPGAINPTVTLQVLQSGQFKTGCERDRASSAKEKSGTYAEYNIEHPEDNRGQKQMCELDHLVSLELGGADTVDNIWPQCGPDGVPLAKRYFKIKDSVENYLAARVRAGEISLEDAQRGIAKDWTQYIAAARGYWKSHSPRGFGRDS